MNKHKHSVTVVWGHSHDSIQQRVFATEAEKQAYIMGVADGDGWLEHIVLNGDVYTALAEVEDDPDVLSGRVYELCQDERRILAASEESRTCA